MTETTTARSACPNCHHALVPVHAVEGRKRRELYRTCPEPYCEYEEMPEHPAAALPRPAERIERR